jgi:hypothetical protein
MRSYEDLDAPNGMNRAPRSSRDLTARSFENKLMGTEKTNMYLEKCHEIFKKFKHGFV